MLTTTSYNELQQAQQALHHIADVRPEIHEQFINLIQLTRQLQYKLQYLGCLIMDEETDQNAPHHQNPFVLSVYKREINDFKKSAGATLLIQMLANFEKLGYATVCRLALGVNPTQLVGPKVV
ncbi:hypothetical protein [Lentibacillus saliphilus]|uniref:hypothetical protein n=1 Tax=Lentibacillus saliphilus TaxID=2737028 RepID=UPI001C30DEAE|nr:hypothetical protein [Lentibacillus saliphilus]